MRIISVTQKDDRNVSIVLDNEKVLFLSNEIFMKSGLRKGNEISEDLFSSLVEENRSFFLKQKAFRYLGRRLHSVKELRLKLRRKDCDDRLIELVVEELKDKNYLNDYDFAVQFTDENIKNKLWGRAKLESELRKKGIEREIIDEVLREKLTGESEAENAVLLLQKKLETLDIKKSNEEKTKLKLINYLAGKGYDYDAIRQAVEECLKGHG